LLTVLALAVGGNVSEGILKALALSRLRCRVVGADVGPHKLGLYTVDRAYLAPYAREPHFADWLIELCRKERVDAVLTGAEAILPVLAQLAPRVHAETGAVCLVSAPDTYRVGDDKLLTCQWLDAHGFPCAAYAKSDDVAAVRALAEAHGYPLLAKPRGGGGCRGLLRIENEAGLALVAGNPDYLVQQYIGNDAEEYTAGCFCDRDGRVRGCIVMRRELHEGTTAFAEAGLFPDVRDTAVRIAEQLRPMGPCNIQMRMHAEQAVCFELNIRFSGTTPVRARMGFNEVEAALRHYVLGEPARELPVVTRGVMIRYWNEMYVDPDGCEQLRQAGMLDAPGRFLRQVENYGIRPCEFS